MLLLHVLAVIGPLRALQVSAGGKGAFTVVDGTRKKKKCNNLLLISYFGYPVRTQLSVCTPAKIYRSFLVLLLVCVAVFRVPTGA